MEGLDHGTDTDALALHYGYQMTTSRGTLWISLGVGMWLLPAIHALATRSQNVRASNTTVEQVGFFTLVVAVAVTIRLIWKEVRVGTSDIGGMVSRVLQFMTPVFALDCLVLPHTGLRSVTFVSYLGLIVVYFAAIGPRAYSRDFEPKPFVEGGFLDRFWSTAQRRRDLQKSRDAGRGA